MKEKKIYKVECKECGKAFKTKRTKRKRCGSCIVEYIIDTLLGRFLPF